MNRDTLEQILQHLHNRELHKCCCVSRLVNEISKSIQKQREQDILTRSMRLRKMIQQNDKARLASFITEAVPVEDRSALIIEASLLCIHHGNDDIFQKLVQYFPATLKKHMYHIVMLCQWPIGTRVYGLLVKLCEHDVRLCRMIETQQNAPQ